MNLASSKCFDGNRVLLKIRCLCHTNFTLVCRAGEHACCPCHEFHTHCPSIYITLRNSLLISSNQETYLDMSAWDYLDWVNAGEKTLPNYRQCQVIGWGPHMSEERTVSCAHMQCGQVSRVTATTAFLIWQTESSFNVDLIGVFCHKTSK